MSSHTQAGDSGEGNGSAPQQQGPESVKFLLLTEQEHRELLRLYDCVLGCNFALLSVCQAGSA